MSEPTRWRDEAPDDVRALLRGATRTRDMTAEERARSRARLSRATGIAVAAGATAWLQGAAIGAVLGVLAIGAAYVVSAWPTPTPVIARASEASPTASARPSVSASAPPIPEVTAEAPPSAVLPPRRPAPRPLEEPAAASEGAVPRPDSLAEEAALIERARAALGANPAEALAITEAHAARFAGGKLAMERELVAIDALRRLGRSVEARARGEGLLSRARGGLYEERIQQLLDGMR